jgi:short-subunit dehydrogenase
VTALVTGATAGIGRAFVERLARDGHDLVVVARTTTRLEEVAEQVSATHGVDVEVLAADLADADDLARVVDRVETTARPVELLVNNAGFGLHRPFLQTTLADQDRYLDVLVRAVLHLTHAGGRGMAERGHGAIVNVASVAAFSPLNTYSAHKAWVTTFSQAVAAELAPRGVRVMSLNPGFVRTEFHQRARMSTSDIPSFMWLDADAVVDTALADLRRGRTLSIPDPRYKVLSSAMRLLPDGLIGRVGRGMRSRQGHDG